MKLNWKYEFKYNITAIQIDKRFSKDQKTTGGLIVITVFTAILFKSLTFKKSPIHNFLEDTSTETFQKDAIQNYPGLINFDTASIISFFQSFNSP